MNAQLKRRALGRGLDALIPGGGGAAATRGEYFVTPIEEIHPSPDQPRQVFDEAKLEELAQSIRASGVIQPLLVRERREGGYWLIAGERRWRASQRAGLHDVPVVVREASPAVAFEMALVENLQRADLDPLEEAEAYRRLSDEYGYTHEKLAERVGKDRATITNMLRLLKLPEQVRGLVHKGELSMGHARALLAVDSVAEMEAAARKVVAKSLSVRATEDLVRGKDKPPAKSAPAKSASVRDLEQKLTRTLGARVQINDSGKGKGGTIEIHYASLDDLDRILEKLYPHR